VRRRMLLVALVGLAVVVAAGAVVLWPSQPNRITRENCDSIRAGMTRAEVEAILGAPSDYRTGLGEWEYGGTWRVDPIVDPPNLFCYWKEMPSHLTWGTWLSDSYGVGIAIDDSEHVMLKIGGQRRKRQHPLANLLWRLKRQWHRWFPE